MRGVEASPRALVLELNKADATAILLPIRESDLAAPEDGSKPPPRPVRGRPQPQRRACAIGVGWETQGALFRIDWGA